MTVFNSTTSSTQPSGDLTISLHRARTGDFYAVAGSLRLHSSYDPLAEAERFVRTRLHGRTPSTVILLGDTLPYVRRTLQTAAATARRVLVFYHPLFYEAWLQETARAPAAHNEVGFPGFAGRDAALQAFLDEQLTERETEGILVLEWPQSAAAFPDLSQRINRALAGKIREVSASIATSVGFSRLWVRNALKNYLSMRTVTTLPATPLPVVVAASGPSLRRALPHLQALRRSHYLIALPSSLSALLDAGLAPDLVVATDPGFWARPHLAPLWDYPDLPIAMPLTSAPSPEREHLRIALFTEDSFVERELLTSCSNNFPTLLPGGTVASTALSIAEHVSDRPPIFAGLDLAFQDIREHVSPHAFEPYLALASSRLRPYYSLSARRALDQAADQGPSGDSGEHRLSSPRAFRTYGEWLNQIAARRSVYRLLPEGRRIHGLVELTADGFARLLGDDSHRQSDARRPVSLPLPSTDARRAHARKRLVNWRTIVEDAGRAASRDDRIRAVLRDPRLTEVLWALAPQAYLRLRRSQREDSEARTSEVFRETASEVSRFVSSLEARYLR